MLYFEESVAHLATLEGRSMREEMSDWKRSDPLLWLIVEGCF